MRKKQTQKTTNLESSFTLRMTVSDRRLFRKAAMLAGKRMSAWARDVLIQCAEREMKRSP